MKIGLYFGSFNPIHIGHLIIAEYIREDAALDEIWLVVSPQNPHKAKESLLPEFDRLHLCRLATEDDDRFRASDVEFEQPRPSYTADTLGHLVAQYPSYQFHLLMGEDNLATLHRWKNYRAIVDHYPILVYPRPNSPAPAETYANVRIVPAPVIDIASTDIRNRIRDGKSVQHMLPPAAWRYIQEMNLYRA